MSDITTLAKPTKEYRSEGNRLMFFAAPATYLAFLFAPSKHALPPVTQMDWLYLTIFGLSLFVAVYNTARGLYAFWQDHKLHFAWRCSLEASRTENDSGFATKDEIDAVGMYDGRGRLFGIDSEGHPIWEPHTIKPTNSAIIAAAGAGKTSCFCVVSCILSIYSWRSYR